MSSGQLLRRLWPADGPQRIFIGFITLVLTTGALAGLRQDPRLLLPGFLIAGLFLAFIEWRLFYYLLFFTLPFSQEIALPGGLSMDVPSEPLMLALTACVLLALLLQTAKLARRDWRHPIVLILGLMLCWSAFDTLFSVDTTKSIKYLMAKVWYLTPFLLGTLLIVRRPAQAWHFAVVYVAGTCLAATYVISHHATRGFSFGDINWALHPFYRNHVTYATVMALLIPFAFFALQGASRLARIGWRVALAIMLFGLLTSYTRASILSLPVAGIFYLILRFRLTKIFLIATAISVSAVAGYFVSGNNFLLYAPNFEKTVFNGENFSKHLQATYNLQDVSGMERVYRWVAASRMIAEKPMTGSGPSTFYPEYKRFTVRSFRTYVSENPEKSTTHNYFLLQLAEQGIPGFVLFLLLISTALLTAERLYHATAQQPALRRVVLAATMSLVVIIFHLLLNELVEVDKIGSVFFVCLALLIRVDGWVEDEKQLAMSNEQ